MNLLPSKAISPITAEPASVGSEGARQSCTLQGMLSTLPGSWSSQHNMTYGHMVRVRCTKVAKFRRLGFRLKTSEAIVYFCPSDG